MMRKSFNKVILSLVATCIMILGASVVSAAPAETTVTFNPASSILTPVTSQAPYKPEVMKISREQKQALDLLNAARTSRGLPPVQINYQLSKLAESYAHDMIDRNFFSHTSPEGLSPFDRMRKAGIQVDRAGENLAFNVDIRAAHQAFMDSPGHKANILDPNYTQIGLGVNAGINLTQSPVEN